MAIENSKRDKEFRNGDIFQEKAEHPFLIMHQQGLNAKMSWRAKGMLAFLMKLPKDWIINMDHLVKISEEGRDVVYKIMHELIEKGYVSKIAQRDKRQKGRFEVFYYVARDITVNPLTEFQEMDKGIDNKGSCPFPENPDPDFQDPEFQYALQKKINTKKENKKTAAINKTPIPKNLGANKNAAVSYFNVFLTPPDLLIGKELTDTQQQCVQECLVKNHQNLTTELFEQVCCGMLDIEHYSASGKDFLKKLNTISSQITKGQWTPPASIEEKKSKKKLDDESEKYRKMNLLQAEIEHAKRMIKMLDDHNARIPWNQMISDAEKKLSEIARH
jgi:hypothetical protein